MAAKKKNPGKSKVEDTSSSDDVDIVVYERRVAMDILKPVGNQQIVGSTSLQGGESGLAPVPSIERKPNYSQIKRRHKLPGSEPIPRNMSDIKV